MGLSLLVWIIRGALGNRLRDISEIYIGITVESQDETVRITFATTKNGSRWSAAWPAKFERAFWEYVNIYRPLLGPRDDALWTARDGFGMTRAAISQRVGDITLARLGRRVSPHLFRDCIATQAQRISPEAVRPAAKVLGHSERVLDEHYGHAETVAASKALAKVVDTMIPMQLSRRSR
ncbi:hypothetical protein [Caenispirillum salinarum]|uniref:hypothetical protein n=1 Tax=Caenispirillum salinarum TaxID=859058 RepID=UPI00384E2B34